MGGPGKDKLIDKQGLNQVIDCCWGECFVLFDKGCNGHHSLESYIEGRERERERERAGLACRTKAPMFDFVPAACLSDSTCVLAYVSATQFVGCEDLDEFEMGQTKSDIVSLC